MRQPLLLAAALFASTALALSTSADPGAPSSGPGEPGAGRPWVISSAAAFRLPPPPGLDASRREIEQLKTHAAERDRATLDRIAYWDTGAPSYRWNQILIDEMVRKGISANIAYRNLSVLHVAIDDAMIAAWDSKHSYARPRPNALDKQLLTAVPTPHTPSYPAEHAVAAGAAAAVLMYLYPQQSEAFRLMGEEAANSRLLAGVAYPSDVTAGLDLGRRVAAQVIERAAADGSGAPWTGTVPTGPGRWTGSNPVLPQAATWRTWVLERPDEFRPAPPSAYDSAERHSELIELRGYHRTPKSNADAGFWEFAVGGLRQYQFWGGQLARLALEYRLDTDARRAAHVFALTYVALYDVGVACWDAKYAYWMIRPFQLDPELRTVFTTPNHPSYPAAHACYSVAAATMLGHFFPRDAQAMTTLGAQAGESRVAAGIHYRSDIVAGAQLGRAVAGKVIERARSDGF